MALDSCELNDDSESNSHRNGRVVVDSIEINDESNNDCAKNA